MRAFSLILLVVLAVVFIENTSAAECQPGEIKKEDCNDCFCAETGLWACTKKFCISKRAISDKPAECKIGDTKKDDCNWCRCIGRGKWGCTRRRCFHKRGISDRLPECKVGNVRNYDCNWCKCIGSGRWACTRRKCFRKRELSCTPGERFKQQCNTCICGATGKIAVCTLMHCHNIAMYS